MTSFRILRAGALALALVMGCGEGTSRAPRCIAPRALPGSSAMPAGIASGIGTADVPSEALVRKRRVCNRLALEPGAFARQHALDAIDWRSWSPQVLAEAAALERPVLALSGYSACEGCAGLSRGALSNRRFARAVNRSFVPVLVDREERPDVDAYLMQAVQVLTGGAGWPTVVFLQADAKPFEAHSWGAAGAAAGTRERKLERIVEEIQRRIMLGGGTLHEKAELAAEKMQRRTTVDPSGPLPDAPATAATLRRYVAESFDPAAGTFGPPPLFPRSPMLDFLLRLGADGRDPAALEMVTVSLDRMRTSAMADVERGGFYRYARQGAWKDPVPEKMLADNAVLATVYLDAAMAAGRADLGETARRIVDFLLEDLRLADGAFAASTGAISDDASRAQSFRDERVLADANALAVSALVRASEVLGEQRYLDAAVKAGKVLDSRLRDGGHVIHCGYANARRCSDGYLSDQAFAALAFLDLDEAGAPGEGRWLDAARTIADALPRRFGHEATGGFFLSAADSQPLPLRSKPALDGAVPCGNSAAAWLYVRLAERTRDEGHSRYSTEAQRTFEAFSEVLMLRPLALPSMVSALARSSAPPQLDPAPAVQP